MPKLRQKVWITRAEPGASATAERVQALGYQAVVAPLLTLQPLTGVRVDLSGVAALAFTSANGVRAFADICGERSLRVFAVGVATAQAARKAGFRAVLSADGDVGALVNGIASRRKELIGTVLHPGALEVAGDLVGGLEAQGVPARTLALYESVPATVDDPQALVASDAVLLHSPKAATVLAGVLRANPAPGLRALGLSRAVLKPLGRLPLAERAYPPFPLEAGLLNLLHR